MAYNGVGVWNRLYNWISDASNGIKIRADRTDAEFNDMCNNGLSTVVTRDGQGSPTVLKVTNASTAYAAVNNTSGAASNASSPAYFRLQQSGTDIGIFGDAYDTIGSALPSNAVAVASKADLYLGCVSGDYVRFYNGTTQFGYIDNNGSLVLTQTGATGQANNFVATNGSNNVTIFHNEITCSDTANGLTVQTGGAGGVNLANGATAWSAVSDYRRKDVFGPFAGSGEIIDGTPVYLARYKGAETWRPMFLAHEIQKAGAGFAVNGEKDAIGDDGKPIYQTLESTDPLVAVLWAEVRDLRKRLADAGL